MENFIEEYANYTKQSILNCGLMDKGIKEKSIVEIDKTLRLAKKGLLTVDEAISRILSYKISMENLNEIIAKIKEKINFRIELMQEKYSGWNLAHAERVGIIDGMLDVLSMLTGKEYTIGENGFEEWKN